MTDPNSTPPSGPTTGDWVTDGGLETDLIFTRGIDLPGFAAYRLLGDTAGRSVLLDYYAEYAAIAASAAAGLLVETPTWRASGDWGVALGDDAAALDRANHAAVDLVREAFARAEVGRAAVSGCIGPRGDGYVAGTTAADEAAEYHQQQIGSLADAGADLVHAMTMTTAAEAVGVVRAARAAGVPVAISFTVETDGTLPDGSPLAAALDAVDAAAAADWYGVNCAHPTHLAAGLDDVRDRLTFLRPNASTMSHEELDATDTLDSGDIGAVAGGVAALRDHLPGLRVLGGCCGTDSRHVAAMWGVPSH